MPVSTVTNLDAQLIADLTGELSPNEQYVTFGFSTSGQILVASRLSQETDRIDKGHGSFPKSRLNEASDYRVLVWCGGSITRVSIRGEFVPCSYIQPTPDGILMVGARCAWKDGSIEQNAVVYDFQGAVLRRFALGDGINDVRCSPDGAIWVSYFDEGIFGNYGWNNPGPSPIGESGLVKFDKSGAVLQSFDATAARTDTICDAYAFNLVSADEVWVYFYTEFPIVRIKDGAYRVWRYGDAGATAIAAKGGRVALCGDYKNASRIRILELDKANTAKAAGEASFTIGNSKPPKNTRAVGVGENFYFVSDRKVYLLNSW